MELDIIFDCYVEKNALIIKNRVLFNNQITQLKQGIEYELLIKPKRKKRSNGQNSYYWGIVVPQVLRGLKEAGFNVFSKDDAHDIIKFKFLKVNLENDSGEFVESFKSTKEMSTSEFKEFIEHLQIWASEYLNQYIPSPNEKLDIEFI
jgi:hypothetical protein